ncbi:hypothetical protein Hanom_Chr12g01123061 [Helianthus anomalus]
MCLNDNRLNININLGPAASRRVAFLVYIIYTPTLSLIHIISLSSLTNHQPTTPTSLPPTTLFFSLLSLHTQALPTSHHYYPLIPPILSHPSTISLPATTNHYLWYWFCV